MVTSVHAVHTSRFERRVRVLWNTQGLADDDATLTLLLLYFLMVEVRAYPCNEEMS